VTDAEPDLVVVAVLREPGRAVPAPGDELTLAVMRYEVETVLAGEYPHRDLFVADAAAAEFPPGARHRLELSRRLPEQATLLSDHDTRGFGVFYCLVRQPA
jgi:hypothetical protein